MTGSVVTADPRTTSSAHRRLRLAVALLVVIGWGGNFVIAKHALNQFEIGAFNAIRFAAMTALGWLVLVVQSRAGGRVSAALPTIDPADRRRFVIVGLVGFAGYVYGFSIGVAYTTAFSASLLLALVPLWVVGLTAAADRRLPRIGQLLALGLAVGGVAVFVSARTSVALGVGDLIAVIVAGLYASYLLLNAPLAARYPAIALTTYAMTIAAVPVVAVSAPSLFSQDWSRVTTLGWLSMLWAIVAPVFLAWSIWNWVLREIPSTEVAPLLFLVPIVSGLTAWLVLGETITAGQLVGTGAVIAALMANHRTASR